MTEEVKRLRCAVADLIGENERLKASFRKLLNSLITFTQRMIRLLTILIL